MEFITFHVLQHLSSKLSGSMCLANLDSVIILTAVQHLGTCQHDMVLISQVGTNCQVVSLERRFFGTSVRINSSFNFKDWSNQSNQALVFQGGIPDDILLKSTTAADLGENHWEAYRLHQDPTAEPGIIYSDMMRWSDKGCGWLALCPIAVQFKDWNVLSLVRLDRNTLSTCKCGERTNALMSRLHFVMFTGQTRHVRLQLAFKARLYLTLMDLLCVQSAHQAWRTASHEKASSDAARK